MWRVPPVDIRLVRTHDEFAACEAMSRDIWGAAERNVVPRELLLTMQHNGGLRDLNRSFKAARKVDRSLRYHDYLHAKKAAMLEAIAREVEGSRS